MTKAQNATLRAAIQEWIDNDTTREFIVGDETVNCMTDAAAAVLDAVAEVQRFAVAEGYLQESYKASR